MSKLIYVEAKPGEVPDALLCKACETYFVGTQAQRHIECRPTHRIVWLKQEVV